MLNRIKTFIGLQSLQVDAFVQHGKTTSKQLSLTLKWSATERRTLTGVHLKFKEEYSRGRWTGKHRQTYPLGEFQQEGQWSVQPDLPYLLNVEMPIHPMFNPLDRYHRNPLLRPVTTGIKWLENVRSTYYLEVTTRIQGAALPSVKRIDLPGLLLE
ncbi:MAG: hypothetical protein H6568_01865 [Lewinellaceae bacterium]|nr:hypothetical protein [Saprospiraceae bacterium]MCB9311487.1 hypothetical protein [Lewinellaceae bacterium]HRW75529.1 hypothetical protein [Saprospiraceae bacterium]